MEELAWIAHRRGKRQRIKQLVKWGKTPEADWRGPGPQAAPKPNELPLRQREHRGPLPKRLEHTPQRNKYHDHPGIRATAAVADEAPRSFRRLAFLGGCKVPVPGRVPPATAPIVPAVWSVHPKAIESRNEHAQRLSLGHAPHGCLIPALGFACGVLSHAGDSLDLGADEEIGRASCRERV